MMGFQRRKSKHIQVKVRSIMLEQFFKLEWRGKDHRELLEMVERESFDALLGALYDWVGTMLSRWLRTITWVNPETGEKEEALWSDALGKYWHVEDAYKRPELWEQYVQKKKIQLERDAQRINRDAIATEELTGIKQPRARIVYDLFEEDA
jgi:hypothetical protein